MLHDTQAAPEPNTRVGLQTSNLRKVDDSWNIVMITDLDRLVRLFSFLCADADDEDTPY